MDLFFGDSITEGSNSDLRFTDFLPKNINLGISGTTIGEYSIYPVDGHSLMSLFPKTDHIVNAATNIFLEYGVNDVSSIMCGFTTLDIAIISFIKALDGIKQINTSANVYCLVLSHDSDIIVRYAKLQCEYLKSVYFKGYDFEFPVSIWADNYYKLIEAFRKRVFTIPMIDDITFFDENAECLSDDDLHPNPKGHEIIANTIKKYI